MKLIKEFITYCKNQNRVKIYPIQFYLMALYVCGFFSMGITIIFGAWVFSFKEIFVDSRPPESLSIGFFVLWALMYLGFVFLYTREIFERLKQDYEPEMQEMYQIVHNTPKDKIYIKDISFNPNSSSLNNYEVVIDCDQYVLCMYKKNEQRYNCKIDKTTGGEVTDYKPLSFYIHLMENRIRQVYTDNKKQLAQKKDESIPSEANDFFKDVSKAMNNSLKSES